MARIEDLQQKEIINISDGTRLGFISDVEINIKTGQMTGIIVSGCSKFLGIFGKDIEYVIPWCDIKKIGDDIILIDVCIEDVIVKI